MNKHFSLVWALVLVFAVVPVHAQQVFKRVSCKDFFDSRFTRLEIAYNNSINPVRFAVQITRDGCIPKPGGGDFGLAWDDGSQERLANLRRYGRFTNVITGSLGSLSKIEFWFDPQGSRARGTFDMTVTVE